MTYITRVFQDFNHCTNMRTRKVKYCRDCKTKQHQYCEIKANETRKTETQ